MYGPPWGVWGVFVFFFFLFFFFVYICVAFVVAFVVCFSDRKRDRKRDSKETERATKKAGPQTETRPFSPLQLTASQHSQRLKSNLLALLQGLEAIGLDGGEMHKDVLAALIVGNEAITLLCVEPLDCTVHSWHLHRNVS